MPDDKKYFNASDADLLKAMSNTESVELMKLLARSELDEWNPYKPMQYAAIAAGFFVLSIVFIFLRIGIGFEGKNTSYHRELIASQAISYIVDGRTVELSDGNYPVAIPSSDAAITINGARKFPMLLILVPMEDRSFGLYPLNIEDDSFLPRQGSMMPLRILIGFTSPHAESTLQYDEKHGDVEDYKRKAYYYLEVRRGVGRMRRGYYPEGISLDINHPRESLEAIDRLIN